MYNVTCFIIKFSILNKFCLFTMKILKHLIIYESINISI